MTLIEAVGWSATLCVTAHIWMIGSKSPGSRAIGFTLGFLSCFLWGYVGVYSGQIPLLVLQFVIAGVLVRGFYNNVNEWREHNVR